MLPLVCRQSRRSQRTAHGFVRTKAWQLQSIVQTGEAISINMFTASGDDTKRWWPADFELVFRATFGAELKLELVATNTAATPCRFEEAIHSYFRLGQIEKAQLQGLTGVQYLDKTDAGRKKTQQGPVVIASETDRVYLGTQGAVELQDRVLQRRIQIAKENSDTTVVWNPWAEKSKALADFGDDEWKQMVCVETSNVADFAVELAPGQNHGMKASVRVADFENPSGSSSGPLDGGAATLARTPGSRSVSGPSG